MSLDQTIRYSTPDFSGSNFLNPYGVYDYLIVPDSIVSNASDPNSPFIPAVLDSSFVSTADGGVWKMNAAGVWVEQYTYAQFSPSVPDPFIRNQLDVTTIEPNISNSPNIGVVLPATSDSVNLGVSGSLTNLQLLGDGSVISESATAAHIVADGVGGQVTYGPAAITAVTSLSIVGNTGLSLGCNSNDVSIVPAVGNVIATGTAVTITSSSNDINIHSGNNNILNATGSNELKVGGTTYLNTQSGAIQALVPIQSTISGAPQYSSGADTATGVESATGRVNVYASSTQVLSASTSSLFVGSNIINGPSGSAAFPGYGFATDTTSGLYLPAAGSCALSAGGIAKWTVAAANSTSAATILPSVANTYNLGSAGADWANIYSQNVLNVVSDVRMKKDISELSDQLGLSFIESLKPVSYKWKDEHVDKKLHFGFIAQDLEETLKRGFHVNESNLVTHHEDIDKYTVSYEELIAPMVKCIKELSSKVSKLELETALLRSRVREIESMDGDESVED